jgi:MFS family permease
VLLAMTGIVTDIQGVALLPLVGTMTRDLGLSSSQVSWTLNALSVASAVSLGLISRYADIAGHKKVLVPLMAVGLVGCVVCALAHTFVILLLGRVLTGLAISAPMAWAMLKIRTDARGIQSAALMTGTVISIMTPIGLILGGLLLKAGTSWSTVFWIVAAGYAIMLVMAVLAPETPVEMRSKVRLDWLGAFGLGAWLVCLLLALSNGESWGWGSGRVIGLFAAAVVLFAIWVGIERGVRHPLLDFSNMDRRQVFAGYASYCGVAALASGMYLIQPALAQTPSAVGYGFGSSVLESSMTLLPILPATFAATMTSKYMLERFGPRAPMVFGGVLVAIAYLFDAAFHSHIWELYVGTAIYGYGIVICFNIGWALVGAAGRQDNMSITFGVQYALALPVAALSTAIMLVVINSSHIAGTPVPSEGVYTADFLILAGLAVVLLVAVGLFVVPKRLSHHGSIETAIPSTDGLEGFGTPPIESARS